MLLNGQMAPDSIRAEQLQRWLQQIAANRSDKEVAVIRDALALAEHAGRSDQTRIMGPRSLDAVMRTAAILNELKLDTQTLVAALLSNLPTDLRAGLRTGPSTGAGYSPESARERFGPAVAELLRHVSLIREISASSSKDVNEQSVEPLRRMLLGLADDVRALMVVLARRLARMRGLAQEPEQDRRRVALETQLVHAPLANRLGIWQLKWELEDLCLQHLEPDAYQSIAASLAGESESREAFIDQVTERLGTACRESHIAASISGRPKHIFSIWKKMRRKGVPFEQIFDVRAIRVLVDTVPQCYEVLGMVHGMWRPVPGEFDDYIARPKGNGYASLHTAVVALDGAPLEVQIRTRQMHEHAERGVAAHWLYKERSQSDEELERRIHWMRRWLQNPDESPEEGEDLEFQAKRIYVLSPQGLVVELPTGATPVDFAYAIHTAVGERCRGAKVDGRMAPLTQALQSGQTVEILTAKTGGPSRDWLNPHSGYVTTARARNRIRHWFKSQDFDTHVQAGRAAVERETARLGLPKPNLDKLAGRFKLGSVNELLAAVGRGDLSAIQVTHTQLQSRPADPETEIRARLEKRASRVNRAGRRPGPAFDVQGVTELLTQVAKCCKPVPYDEITGFITRGRGVTVHRSSCPVVAKMSSDQRARLIEVHWAQEQSQSSFMVDVQVLATDRKGLLRDTSSIFANEEVDVLGVQTQSDQRKDVATMRFTVEVKDLIQLSRVMDKLSQIPDVLDVRRQV